MNDILKNHIHAAIMNIQIDLIKRKEAYQECQLINPEAWIFSEIIDTAYKLGHRDARHAAAELIKGE